MEGTRGAGGEPFLPRKAIDRENGVVGEGSARAVETPARKHFLVFGSPGDCASESDMEGASSVPAAG